MDKAGYKRPSIEESFNAWALTMIWRIEVLMDRGFSKDQAIEMLKFYLLSNMDELVDAVSCIS